MQYTALSTHPILQGKSRELRIIFADVYNNSVQQGRTHEEAIFKGLAIVKQVEQKSVKKFVKPSIPSHLKALLDLKNNPNRHQEVEQNLETEQSLEVSAHSNKDIIGASFDSQGRLILKFKDGTNMTTNPAPVIAVETNVIVVGSQGVQGATPEVVEGLKQLTYTGEDLSRVDMPDGSYKLLTYTDTVLTQVDHVQATQTVRQTLYYTTGVLTSVNTEII